MTSCFSVLYFSQLNSEKTVKYIFRLYPCTVNNRNILNETVYHNVSAFSINQHHCLWICFETTVRFSFIINTRVKNFVGKNSSKIWVEEKCYCFVAIPYEKKGKLMLGRLFHSNSKAWRERKYMWTNTTKKSIYSTGKLYVTAWKKSNLCFSLCRPMLVLVRERIDCFTLCLFVLKEWRWMSVCFFFNAWVLCLWTRLARKSHFLYTFRKRKVDRKKNLRWKTILRVLVNFSRFFSWKKMENFTRKCWMFNITLINNKKFYDNYYGRM